MNLEWVPWPPNAVMDTARLGQIGVAAHHLEKADRAAQAVWRATKNVKGSPKLILRARSAAASIAHEIVLKPPAAGMIEGAVESRIKQSFVREVRHRGWNPMSWFGPTKKKLLVDSTKSGFKATEKQAARLTADAIRRPILEKATTTAAKEALQHDATTVASRLVPKLANSSSTLAKIGRISARWTIGFQWIFGCHDVIQERRILRDEHSSRAKKVLAKVTSWMSGIAMFAPLLPFPYKWPITSAAAIVGALTGTARDVIK